MCKAIELMLYAAVFNACPWVNTDIATEAYLRMGKVTVVTFTYTFFHAFIYLLCKGWHLTIHAIDRNQATNVTMVMGMIYLIYSAYFLTIDIEGMMEFVNIVLALVYFVLGLVNLQSLAIQIKITKRYLLVADDAIPQAFQRSVKLKY
jgi:hypothetical protein